MFEIPIDVTRRYQITAPDTYTFRVWRRDETKQDDGMLERSESARSLRFVQSCS
jgi:hypothetical protein